MGSLDVGNVGVAANSNFSLKPVSTSSSGIIVGGKFNFGEFFDQEPLSDWEIKMKQIDDIIQERAYEKYPAKLGPKGTIAEGTDYNLRKREKYIEKITEQYRKISPEYDSYCLRKEMKEKEKRLRIFIENTRAGLF